jgi:putative lipoprotein
MNSLLGICLAINVLYGQAAAAQPHPDAWFGVDKIKHFFMSAFIESISYSALQAAHARHRTAMTGAIGITLGLGLAREIHDMRTPGNIFSVRDLTWDVLGTGAGAALLAHTIR